jgi:hypothetical protein
MRSQVSFMVAVDGFGWLAGREGLEAGDRGGDLRGPVPVAASWSRRLIWALGTGEDPEPQPFPYSVADSAGEGKHLPRIPAASWNGPACR